jgi:membrane protein DedA with SNARE-associated domain
MMDQVTAWLAAFSAVVPLELFVFAGSIIEEIIAPIPSILITSIAGTLALTAGYGILGLVWLSLIAALGKTIGCVVIYMVADKAEGLIVGRLGKYIGVSHEEVERMGTYFKGGMRDYAILILIRALPVLPSLPISVMAGVIKFPFMPHAVATYIGSFLRSVLFIGFGYLGLSAVENIGKNLTSIESMVQIGIAVFLFVFLVLVYLKRRQMNRPSV